MKNLKVFAPLLPTLIIIGFIFYAIFDATIKDVYAISHSTGKCVYVDTIEGRKKCPEKLPERYSKYWVE